MLCFTYNSLGNWKSNAHANILSKKKLNLSLLTHLNIKFYNQNIAFKPNNRNINIEWTTKWDQKWKNSKNVTQNSIQTWSTHTKFNSDNPPKKMIFHSINYEMLLILSPRTVIDYNVSTCFGSHTIHREIEKLMYTQKYIIKKKLNLSLLMHLNIEYYNQNISFEQNNTNINIEWTTKWDQKDETSTNVTTKFNSNTIHAL